MIADDYLRIGLLFPLKGAKKGTKDSRYRVDYIGTWGIDKRYYLKKLNAMKVIRRLMKEKEGF